MGMCLSRRRRSLLLFGWGRSESLSLKMRERPQGGLPRRRPVGNVSISQEAFVAALRMGRSENL